VPGVRETSESRQWELFDQLRKDISDYFGFLHGEIAGLRKEIQCVDSRLDSMTTLLDHQCTSLRNDIETLIQKETKQIDEKVETLKEHCEAQSEHTLAHIDEMSIKLDRLRLFSHYDKPPTPTKHSKQEDPLTPPESPKSEAAETPSITPVYDDTTKQRRKKSRRIPIRCAIGARPSRASCVSRILVKGKACTISKDYVPLEFKITKTDTQRKVTLPVYLPNAAALSQDKRQGNALILKLWIEFRVLENSSTVFTIGQDVIKAHGYNLDIDWWRNVIVITNATNNFKMKPFRIPIIENPSRSSRLTTSYRSSTSMPDRVYEPNIYDC
jgi:hypothetical protein